MGCCSCLSFLLEPIKLVRSFHAPPYEFSVTENVEDVDGFCISGDAVERNRRVIKSRPICRETPVKETRHLVLDKDEDGRKIINEYVRQRTLRVGNLCKVVLYQGINDGNLYAIKTFYKTRLLKLRVAPSETAMTDVLREVSIMKMVEHPNIVNLIEVIDDPDQDLLYMVLEYVERDCICEGSGPPGGMDEFVARKYFRDIVAGLIYLHAHNIVHGDIKPENLLVTSSGRVKIADFGVSHVFEPAFYGLSQEVYGKWAPEAQLSRNDGNDDLRRSPGTPVFTAPECCLGLTYKGKAADIWALGITVYCMMLGRCPFIGDTLQNTFDKIVNDPLPLPDELDPELKDLLKGLLCKDAKHRFSLSTVEDHLWVVRSHGPIPRTTCRCNLGACRT